MVAGIPLTNLKQCLQFLLWLKGHSGMQNQVISELVKRYGESYNHISFTGQLPPAVSEFLWNVSTFYTRLCKIPTAGSYVNPKAKDVTDALLECVPKFLAALYFLLYNVDRWFEAVGGGKWRDDNPGWETTWVRYVWHREWGGRLQNYLRARQSVKYGDLIPGGFGPEEVTYGYDYDPLYGYWYGESMVNDLQKILYKHNHKYNDFRDVFFTTVISKSGTQISNTANVLALVRTFCQIVDAEAKNDQGKRLKAVLERELKDKCINWPNLVAHCSKLQDQLGKLFKIDGFSYTGQARTVYELNTEKFAGETAKWFRNNLHEVQKNVQRIDTNFPVDNTLYLTALQPFATKNIFPYGFIFGKGQYGTLGDAWKKLSDHWPSVIGMLGKNGDGLDMLKTLLDDERCHHTAPPKPRPRPAPRPPRPARPAPPHQPSRTSTVRQSGTRSVGGWLSSGNYGSGARGVGGNNYRGGFNGSRGVRWATRRRVQGQGPRGGVHAKGAQRSSISGHTVSTEPQLLQSQSNPQPHPQQPPGPSAPGDPAIPIQPGGPGPISTDSVTPGTRTTSSPQDVLTQTPSVSGSNTGSDGDQHDGGGGGKQLSPEEEKRLKYYEEILEAKRDVFHKQDEERKKVAAELGKRLNEEDPQKKKEADAERKYRKDLEVREQLFLQHYHPKNTIRHQNAVVPSQSANQDPYALVGLEGSTLDADVIFADGEAVQDTFFEYNEKEWQKKLLDEQEQNAIMNHLRDETNKKRSEDADKLNQSQQELMEAAKREAEDRKLFDAVKRIPQPAPLKANFYDIPLAYPIKPPNLPRKSLPPPPPLIELKGRTVSDHKLPPLPSASPLKGEPVAPPPQPTIDFEIDKPYAPEQIAKMESRRTAYLPNEIIAPAPLPSYKVDFDIAPKVKVYNNSKYMSTTNLKPQPPSKPDLDVYVPNHILQDHVDDLDFDHDPPPPPTAEPLEPIGPSTTAIALNFPPIEALPKLPDSVPSKYIHSPDAVQMCVAPWINQQPTDNFADIPETELFPSETPNTVRDMLIWIAGLQHKKHQDTLEQCINNAFKRGDDDSASLTLPANDYNITTTQVHDTLKLVSMFSSSVLSTIAPNWRLAVSSVTAKPKGSDQSKEPDCCALLCQLRDYVYACHHQLEFLKSQCSRNSTRGGWQDCPDGRDVSSPKSPLQAFLTDASPFKTHPFDPCNICRKSRVKMGFTKEDLPRTQQTGKDIFTILSPVCGGEDPLMTLTSYLNCITRRTPRTTGELVSFFHHFGNELHDVYSDLSKLGSALSNRHDDCPDWDRLEAADLRVIKGARGSATPNSIHDHIKDHPNTLSTLIGCGIVNVQCPQHMKPITYRAYSLYSPSFAHNYLSWVVHLADRLWDSLLRLRCDLDNLQCHDSKPLHQCLKVLPLLYSHGFTPPDGTLHSSLTCSKVIAKLEQVVNGKPIAGLMTAMDTFLYNIRMPFLFCLVALWLIAALYILIVMLYRMDVLRIRSHLLNTRASHLIDVKALLTKGRRMLSLYHGVDYFDDEPVERFDVK
ncbi:Ribosome-binding protein 1 [Babesia ovata]|uniref:Ribosome-binding protein 1 n=1 Tax=Babesia ovata TaxID=189622 RepID=A0A2H6K8I2_9APIC|nr:Ribosome-binding protein 1 [Babesia ovata]GBE59259.1 Ribosome-binding protein 1 [Babesia ovata]